MTGLGLTLLIAASLCVLTLPPRWALVALIVGTVYLTKGLGFTIGGVMLHSHRILLLVAVLRMFTKDELSGIRLQFVDKLVLASIGWLLFANIFHEQEPGSGFIFSAGTGFEALSSYFLIRAWCRGFEEVQLLAGSLAIVFVPIALSMLAEKSLVTNPLGILGSGEFVNIREGIVRSRGTFTHAILAGSIAAACFPLMLSIWRNNKLLSIVGMVAILSMVVSCHSSGPLVSFFVTCAILFGWVLRHHTRKMVWLAIIGYIVISLISNRPGYHAIVTRLDLTGSSTAYYRCLMIDTAIAHFNEWWLIGTDRTVHWIQSGVGSIIGDGKHMDITNMYIATGVNGGFLSTLSLFGIVVFSIRNVVLMATNENILGSDVERFSIWCLGAAVGSLAISGLSVAFFDQSGAFIWYFTAFISSSFEGFRKGIHETNLESNVLQYEAAAANQTYGQSAPCFSSRNANRNDNVAL